MSNTQSNSRPFDHTPSDHKPSEQTSAEQRKWRRLPLKNRWYDDNYGFDATARELAENRVRQLDARVLKNDEEDVGSREVERFFDLFEPQG